MILKNEQESARREETSWVRRFLWLEVLAVVAVLDLAAIHDIVAGEPSLWQEWTVLAASGGLLTLLGRRYLRYRHQLEGEAEAAEGADWRLQGEE